MKFCLALVLASSLTSFSALSFENVRIDFKDAAGTARVKHAGNGTFEGVLPPRVEENLCWSTARVTSEAMEDGGRRFVRIVSQPTGSGGQFKVNFGRYEAGCYRLDVSARARRTSMRLLMRHGAPHYATVWSGSFRSREWAVRSYCFRLRPKDLENVGFYVLTGTGDQTDIEYISLYGIPEEEYEKTLRPVRPDKSRREYVRHTRFPLGLPSGWNTDREAVFATCGAVSGGEDGFDCLRFETTESDRDCRLYSEPFLTAYPDEPHTVEIRYRAKGAWSAQVVEDDLWAVRARLGLEPTEAWRTVRFEVRPTALSHAAAVAFVGRGRLELDSFRVYVGKKPPAADPSRVAEVALSAVENRDLAGTRVQFEDDPATVRWTAFGAPQGAVLKSRVTDLYGNGRELPDRPLRETGRVCGTIDFAPNDPVRLGQFRIDAWVEADGRRISPVDEIVVSRVERPVHWGRLAPESPFGSHMIARPVTVTSAKACGVNWTRFHDAGTEYSGWYDLEREKGKWTFHDREIGIFRNAGIMMYAQLGTAPNWATRIAETRLANAPHDYFAKFLRPTNMVDHLEYVRRFVTRYRGVIDDYFIWNEPWGRWWVGAADAKLYSTDRTELVRQYGEYSNATYREAKAANPQARISGFNSCGGNMDWWMAPLIDVGVMDACDDVDFHYYTPDTRLLSVDETDLSEGTLRLLRARWPDLKGKRVIMSEGQGTTSGDDGAAGRMTGLYSAILPFAPEGKDEYVRLSDSACRYILGLLSEGVSRVFVYTTHSYSAMAVKPRFQTLFGPDGFPHPQYAAHAHMAKLIEGRKFVSKKRFGGNGLVLRFAGSDGDVEAYAELERDELLALAKRFPGRVTDLYGNPVTEANCLPGTLTYVRHCGKSRFNEEGGSGEAP